MHRYLTIITGSYHRKVTNIFHRAVREVLYVFTDNSCVGRI
jgi:hypothetical protein